MARNKHLSYNDIPNLQTDWMADPTNDNKPFAGESVQAFIKKMLNEKGGEFYFDQDTAKYLVFADAEKRDLYLSDREEHADLIIGSFDAPANYSAEINMATPVNNTILKGTKGNYIDFTFDIKSRNGSSTGEAVIATFTFNNTGNIKKVTQIFNAGTNVHFLIDEYLSDGANSVGVTITGRTTLVSTMAAVNYTVVALTLTSSLNFAQPVETEDYLSVPYHLEGAGVKYLEWYLDGVLMQGETDTIADLVVNRTKNINTEGLSVGKHNIQVRAYTTNGGVNYYSSTLYFDFVVAPEELIWQENVTYVLLGTTLAQPSVGSINVNATQYDSFTCQVAVYDSRSRSLDVVMTDNGSRVKSVTMYSEEPQSIVYAPTEVGEHTIAFVIGEVSATILMTVSSSEVGISEATEGLLLRLSAKGRSNSESNPGVWAYDNITTTFNGFTWGQDGWHDDALVIPAGGSINIGLAALSGNVTSTGRTIEIEFSVDKTVDEEAVIMSLINSITNAGLEIKATTAKLLSSGGANVETKFRAGDRIRLAFIINKTSGDDARMMYIVNNGILERAARFAVTDNFSASENLVIGSLGCSVHVYSVYVYNRALSVDESFCNYAVNSPNLISIASRNDIYDSVSGAISVDKVNAHIPVMIITGDISYILGITDKAQKNAWNPTPVNIEFRNMQNPEMNFFIDEGDIRLQGTSSISYPRKNFRIYSKSKSGKYQTKLFTPTHNPSDLVTSGKYAFKEGAAPVSCWCLKADYAESSGSHNTGIAKLWNTLIYNTLVDGEHPLRTAAQNWAAAHGYPYDVRTTIDGFPIVLFQRDNENAPLTCFGQYNFNNDKSTEDVYGFTALSVEDDEGNVETFDNSHVQCFEVLDSDNPIALFTDVSNFDAGWEDAFEARHPDKNKDVTALKRVTEFLNSCYLGMDGETMLLDLAKWRAEKANYFDLPKLASDYVYLNRFGAVDQPVKNAMFTTEDGLHWFYILYDNDTVFGIDNASKLFDTWDYGFKTKTPQGGYYYAGKGLSVLWNLFEADEECMALARMIDGKLFDAGMTYENLCAMFDVEQCGKWCERLYNENGRYKYIEQALLGQNVLYMLQGSRKSHRHWWLQHRFEKYDNVYGTGTYTRRSIQARATGTVNIPQGAAYKFIPAKSANYGYSVASTIVDAPTAREAGVEYTATGLPQATGVGNLIYIHNANNLRKLDLSAYINALGTVNLSSAINVNGDSELRILVLGDGENHNEFLTDISGLSVMKDLEELNIQGYRAITSLEFASLPNLHTLYAGDSGLTSFVSAMGATIALLELPSCMQSIVLNEAAVTALNYTPNKNLSLLTLNNVTGAWDAKGFVNAWLDLFTDSELEDLTLNLSGIDWNNMTVAQVLKLGKVGTRNLRGRVVLPSMTQEEYNQIVEVFGPNVFSSESQFIIDAPTGVLLTGPSSVKEGHTVTFTASFFPVTESSIRYLLYNGSTLIEEQTDQQGNIYREYNGVTLYEATGVMEVASGISSDVSVNVRANVSGTESYSSYLAITAVKITYPSAIDINGDSTINQNGMYNYVKVLSGSYNAQITDVSWSLESNNASTLYNSDNNSATVNVTNTPASSIEVVLLCAVTFEGGVVMRGLKNITMVLTYPSSVAITGDASISDNGEFYYGKVLYGSFTASLTNVAWSLTANNNVTIKSSDSSGATIAVPNGNDTAVTLTLTCVCTFTGNVTRTATKDIAVAVIAPPITEEWVDLGLPSGLLWCRHNIGAANPEDAGLFFAWGETEGYVDAADRNTKLGRSDGFSSDAYTATGGKAIYDSISNNNNLPLEYDAANVYMGLDWRMPTEAEVLELKNNTDVEEVTIGNVSCLKVMKKTDHSVYIILGRYSRIDGNLGGEVASSGYCWSSTKKYSQGGLLRYSYYIMQGEYEQCRCGCTIRPVREAPKAIDLGLPSGTLWCDRNVGATAPEEAGLYFAWGETEGYKDAADRNAKLTAETGTTYTGGFDQTSYNRPGGASGITGNLSGSNDAAAVNLGGSWRMPTDIEISELVNNTDKEIITINNIGCIKLMNKNNHNVFIIIPSKGGCLNGNSSIAENEERTFSSDNYATDKARYMRAYIFSNNCDISVGQMFKNYGLTIRAVQ